MKIHAGSLSHGILYPYCKCSLLVAIIIFYRLNIPTDLSTPVFHGNEVVPNFPAKIIFDIIQSLRTVCFHITSFVLELFGNFKILRFALRFGVDDPNHQSYGQTVRVSRS